MQDLYNLQVLRGLSGDRSLLSCTDDGTVVDLWSQDDDSGRQQWEIYPAKTAITPGAYTIEVKGGVTGKRNLLSCTSDGTVVDLWIEDDESGRQQWVFTSADQDPLSAVIPYYVTIAPAGGVDNADFVLSASADGTKVELVAGDQGTGLQRFQIQGQPPIAVS